MKKLIYILLLSYSYGFSQSDDQRISNIKNQLELLSVENLGLTEQAKTEISVSDISLANFILAISNAHGVNINIAPELNQITIANNNFSNVTVSDLLVFLCKEYQLTIEFTGSILSIKKYTSPVEIPQEHIIPVVYYPESTSITMDIKNDKLYDVFKRIMDESAKNLVFSPGLENKTLTFYTKDTPFDAAMDKFALANNLYVEKTKDNFYVFEADEVSQNANQNNSKTRRNQNLSYKILDGYNKLLEVDFNNTSIATIIHAIGTDLNINIFTATPLENAGHVTFKARSISFDELLTKMFESQVSTSSGNLQANLGVQQNGNRGNSQNENISVSAASGVFTYKKEGNIYYFGTENQLSVRKVEVIHLMHRTVEMFADPSGGNNRNGNIGSRNSGSFDNTSNSFNNNSNNQFNNGGANNNRNRQSLNTNNTSNFNQQSNSGQALIDVLPYEIKKDLDIKIDFEMNSFYVNGSGANIERFKSFIKKIDKPVPVILIEVMIIEVNRSSSVETGISWGIGENEVNTQGSLFPETDITLGSKTINKVIGGFDGIGSFNLGKVVPEFFANIKALETNGNIKIRSTPKLATLNGHKATLSNGQTSYYAVTQRNIYGTDNPQTSEITNFEPIDAELGLTIKPLVSGDGQVTLDIYVIQSSFGGRIADDAPPDLNSREFTSIIRVKDQDIVVLGGLEEQVKNDSGSGMPLLARIPVIKWLFSKRKREDRKSKLTILIKPTVIN
ncbi:general secretion pathway protein GspD [Changchengzhania lutea]|uniref:general secretion pathway protein GspD n=1 Tax=Changchengzhania lutea TaxID=2049305 RepID=UPI00115F065B|nr:general secretion pathway protein GspD [Changchengzhania lutea]